MLFPAKKKTWTGGILKSLAQILCAALWAHQKHGSSFVPLRRSLALLLLLSRVYLLAEWRRCSSPARWYSREKGRAPLTRSDFRQRGPSLGPGPRGGRFAASLLGPPPSWLPRCVTAQCSLVTLLSCYLPEESSGGIGYGQLGAILYAS
jgi:hypothetical protein